MADVNLSFIHPTAEVSSEASIGAGTRVWHQCQIMNGARIGCECNLGKGVFVDAGVVIGDRVKIQNGVSVYRGVTVADECFLGPNMVFTNDMYPRAMNHSFEVTSTRVEHGASIGANATIVCGVSLGDYSMVAAGSVVTKDVPPHTLVRGNPARPVAYVCNCGKPLGIAYPVSAPASVSCLHCYAVVDLNPLTLQIPKL
jgi:UDP-2-acetamido-3-amino-2,3-dideoxy-glucuronate N-acetyltransferase